MSNHKRRQYFVDRQVQGKLLGQLVNCWALSLLSAGGLTIAGWIFVSPGVSGFVGPNSFMTKILPMVLVGLIASTLALPVMLWSMVRVTHRIAGPMVRFKRHLREAADTGQLVPLHFRDGDEWHELAEAYNRMVACIQAERLGSPQSGVAQQLSPAATNGSSANYTALDAEPDEAELAGTSSR